MTRYEGINRTVFIFGPLALKVAKIHPLKSIASFLWMCRTRKWKLLYKNLFIYRPYQYMSIPFCLLGGIYANLREFLFFWQSQHPFLQPTLLSFFGIINIQIAGQQNKQDHWRLFAEIIMSSNKAHLQGIRHTFFNAHNFCLYKDSLRIVDYDKKEVQRVIQLYGDKIIVALKNLS